MAKFNLKNIDYKKFFLEHGEKLAFVLFLLITLGVLATSRWSTYPKAPEEISLKINQARNQLQLSRWPASEAESFALRDFMEKTRLVRGPISAEPYALTSPLWHPLYRKSELRREPELLAVLDLDAQAGMFVMGLRSKTTEGLAASGASEEGMSGGAPPPGTAVAGATSAGDNEFAPRQNLVGAGGMAGGAGNPYAGNPYAGMSSGGLLNRGGYAPPTDDLANMPATGVGLTPLQGEDPYGGMYGSYGGYGGGGMECRGERFIAVRGIWPLREQLLRLQKALSLENLQEARAVLEIYDFVLERQTAQPGPDPWKGPWVAVDISRAAEVLDEAYDYDFDPVDPRLTDVAITMPLPYRILGAWGDYATHPKIKNFQLSGAERERMAKLEQLLIEEFDKMRLEEESRTKTRGGFARFNRNMQSMASAIFNNPEAETAFTESFQASAKVDRSLQGLNKDQIRALLTNPADRILLFRYIDFDVRPGYAYRYRVKLVLRNPNYGLKDLVADPSFAEGEFRETPWSKESNPAVVPESVHYFLKSVDRDPINEQGRPRAGRPLARFFLAQWDPSVGTMVADNIEVTTYAQLIGEKKKTLRLNVGKPSLKTEEVFLRSEDVLLDAIGDVRIHLEDHPDLKVPTQNKGQLGLAPMIAALTPAGEVKVVDPMTDAAREKELNDRIQREREHFKHLENQDEKKVPAYGEGVGLYGLSGEGYDPYGMMGGEQPGGRKKSKRPLRKPPAAMGSSSY
ncbi:MAG: hypothetical protein KatS3mg114_0621 [Planctomycetaceae bacterium]|nr:MAG: hypothetical protein KatS3mg114_0621 [Planctomycetaceae bacterium]